MDERRWAPRVAMAIVVALLIAGLAALVIAAFWWSPTPGAEAGGAPHLAGIRLSRAELHRLRVPIAIGAVVAVFVVVQAAVGRRDPRLWRAPERADDDTIPFRD